MLNRTPPEQMVDAQGRPDFLWDCEMTLAQFQERLADPDPEVRAYHLGKLMRQARPGMTCGPTAVRETPGSRGITVGPGLDGNGHHGTLHLGRVTASPPER